MTTAVITLADQLTCNVPGLCNVAWNKVQTGGVEWLLQVVFGQVAFGPNLLLDRKIVRDVRWTDVAKPCRLVP